MNQCPTCGSGRLVHLGTLGLRDHYRCESCGMDSSCKARVRRQDKRAMVVTIDDQRPRRRSR